MRTSTSKPPSKIETTLDLPLVVFDGDRDLRAALLRDRDFARAFKAWQALPGGRSARRDLRREPHRRQQQIAPQLFACVDKCIEKLGIQNPVEVYCSQDAQLNAFVVPPQAGTICIGFSSSALERFEDDELRFVLGHELGHAIFEHHGMTTGILDHAGESLATAHAMRLFAYQRYAELTADRVGLLCCGAFDSAVRTFFKLASGLTDPRWYTNVVAAAMQHAAVDAAAIEAAPNQREWFSTHPYSPLRVKALDLFRRSKTYARLAGRRGGTLSEKELEDQVAAIVDVMNPSVLHEQTTCGAQTRRFLALAGMEVAVADKKVKRSELSRTTRVRRMWRDLLARQRSRGSSAATGCSTASTRSAAFRRERAGRSCESWQRSSTSSSRRSAASRSSRTWRSSRSPTGRSSVPSARRSTRSATCST
jgi:Zn-dependent protease with chaperone function